ncbi:hypothetical protein D3C80_1782900 [compost metagenome]
MIIFHRPDHMGVIEAAELHQCLGVQRKHDVPPHIKCAQRSIILDTCRFNGRFTWLVLVTSRLDETESDDVPRGHIGVGGHH